MNAVKHLIVKELKENLLTSKGISFFLVATLVLSVFSILLISNTELSLLDNAQAVYMMSGIALGIIGLLSIVIGSDSFAGEVERRTLESLLLTPLTVPGIAYSKLISNLVVGLFLFVISVPYLWAVGSTGQNLVATLTYLFVTGFLLTAIFSGLSIILSMTLRSFKGALSIGLTIFILSTTPLFLSPSLRQHSIAGKTLDYINPFSCALNTLDSVVIDSQGISYQLVRLGIMITYVAVIVLIIRIISKEVGK